MKIKLKPKNPNGARVMWRDRDGIFWNVEDTDSKDQPFLVIPLTPAALEAMREGVAKAICDCNNRAGDWDRLKEVKPIGKRYRELATAALAAIHPALKEKR